MWTYLLHLLNLIYGPAMHDLAMGFDQLHTCNVLDVWCCAWLLLLAKINWFRHSCTCIPESIMSMNLLIAILIYQQFKHVIINIKHKICFCDNLLICPSAVSWLVRLALTDDELCLVVESLVARYLNFFKAEGPEGFPSDESVSSAVDVEGVTEVNGFSTMVSTYIFAACKHLSSHFRSKENWCQRGV